MKIADQCIICKEMKIIKKDAIVVPFLADRIFGRKAFRTFLICCENCGFKFYAIRPDDTELMHLYDNYREERYLKQRFKHEPWYTKRLNDNLFNRPSIHIDRRNSLIKQIELYNPEITKKIKTVLDYGGDKGQLINGLFEQAKKYVYEISNVDLLPGIEKAIYPSPITFDLIICSNVFEHVSYPDEILKKITEMAHENTLLFLEVPFEHPYSAVTILKRIIQQTMLLFLRPAQFRSTFGRGMFIHMHEHLNYFSRKSLQLLLEDAGYKKIIINVEKINNGKSYCCLAVKSGR